VGWLASPAGTSGTVDSAHVAVDLVDASPVEHALVDRELEVPRGWIVDLGRRAAAGLPEQLGVAAKPELARVLRARALAAGVPAAWVTADEAAGGNPSLRAWLETYRMPQVLAIRCTEVLQVPDGPPTPAKLLAAGRAIPEMGMNGGMNVNTAVI
jgi:SRSO17 transposase